MNQFGEQRLLLQVLRQLNDSDFFTCVSDHYRTKAGTRVLAAT